MFEKTVKSYKSDSNRYPGDYEDVNKFKAWSTKLINALCKDITAAGWKIETKSKGHFHLFVFASKDEKIIYISWDANSSMGYDQVLLRTAKSLKDYTGGPNNFVKISEITQFITNRCDRLA